MCSALPEVYESTCNECMVGEHSACVRVVWEADSGLFGPEQMLGRERIYLLARGCWVGDSLSCVLLSLSVKEGKGTTVDVERGDEMLSIACPGARRRCKRGSPEACTGWGLCAGQPEFTPDSEGLFARACDAGVSFGCVKLAESTSEESILAGALAKACDLSDLPACYDLALRRQFGLGVRGDKEWAMQFYSDQCHKDPGGVACWALHGYIPALSVVKGFITNPDRLVRLRLKDSLPTRRSVVVGHCFNESGVVNHVEILRGSGSPSADAEVIKVASQWRARPWLVRLPVQSGDRTRSEPAKDIAPTQLSVEFIPSGVSKVKAVEWLHTMAEREVRRLGAHYVSRNSVGRATRLGTLKVAVRRVGDSSYMVHSFGPHAYPSTLKITATSRLAGLDAILSALSLVVATAVDTWVPPRPTAPTVAVRNIRCTASTLSFNTWSRAGTGTPPAPIDDDTEGPEDPGTRDREYIESILESLGPE